MFVTNYYQSNVTTYLNLYLVVVAAYRNWKVVQFTNLFNVQYSNMTFLFKWFAWVPHGQCLQNLSIIYVAINNNLEK